MKYRRLVARRSGGPEVLDIVEEDVRDPGQEEVRVRVLRAGVAIGDLLWQSGTIPGGPRPPFTPGYDFVGVVDAQGPGVTGIEPGQTVTALIQYGGYSEVVWAPAGQLVPVPEGLDLDQVACLTLNYVTALQLFQRMKELEPGDRVLVHGAGGGVGSAMLDLGRVLELEIYGTASRPKHELVSSLGGRPIDYRSEDFVERIAELTGDGVDLAVDHIGGSHLVRSFRTLRQGGLLVATSSYANLRGDIGVLEALLGFVRLPLWNALPNGKSAMLFDVVGHSKKNPGVLAEDLKSLFAYLAEGRIEPVVGARFPLLEARQAQETILNARAQGKVLLVNEQI